MHRGYIKLWRKSMDSEHQYDLITKVIWQEILLRVTHQPIEYQGATIPKGGMITTFKELGEFAGGYGRGNKCVTSNQAQRSVNKLVNSGQVTTRKIRNRLLIEVLNYDVYQGSSESESELGHYTETSRTPNGSTTDITPIEQEQKNIRDMSQNASDDVPPILEEPKYPDDSPQMKLAHLLGSRMRDNNPNCRLPNTQVQWQNWADVFRLMEERDGREYADMEDMIKFSQWHEFWKTNILSPNSLRKQYDKLTMERERKRGQSA